MHTHWLSQHPRALAFTDGGQTDGLFYLKAPLDYHKLAAAPTSDVLDASDEGLAEIVFDMAKLRSLAREPGKDDDLILLEGPRHDDGGESCDRHDPRADAWFAGHRDDDLATATVQMLRGDLRSFWVWTLVADIISSLETFAGDHIMRARPAAEALRVLEQISQLLVVPAAPGAA